MADDPWRLLGLAPGATKAEIKAAFKRAAMQCHPDKLATAPEAQQRHAEARFRAIKDAYERLTDHRSTPNAAPASGSAHHAARQYEYDQYMRYQARTRHRYAQAASAAGLSCVSTKPCINTFHSMGTALCQQLYTCRRRLSCSHFRGFVFRVCALFRGGGRAVGVPQRWQEL